VMAAASLPDTPRRAALRAVETAITHPELPAGLLIRRLLEGVPGLQPFAPRAVDATGENGERWRAIPAERRWAMEVLGLGPDMTVERRDVQARFRRLVRLAHPDHGAARTGAAERLAELADARALLLADADRDAQDDGSPDSAQAAGTR